MSKSKMAPAKLGPWFLKGDQENLIGTANNSDTTACQNKSLINNNSVTSFKIDENQVSVTRSMGRRYSTMCFQASPCKTKVDIIVTQGPLKSETETIIFDRNRASLFVSHDKLPRPPLPAKLCLCFIFLLVIAMTIALIIVVTMHSHQDNITDRSPVPGNQPNNWFPGSSDLTVEYRTFIPGNNTLSAFLNETRTDQ